MKFSIKFPETYTSKKDDKHIANAIIAQKKVCLYISVFIFPFSLFLSKVLYNFVPLTPSAKMHGIKIKFWIKIVIIVNNIPFPVPNIAIKAETVYPIQKPLKAIIKNTIGIPISDNPINHSINDSFKFLKIDCFNKFALSIWLSFFIVDIKFSIYDVIWLASWCL